VVERAISDEEAWEVLEPHWRLVTERFERKGFDVDGFGRLVIDSSAHDSCRHFAKTYTDASEVMLAPEMVHLPVPSIQAIMAHELGHVVDVSRPGYCWYRKGALVILPELPSKGLRKLLRQWQERSDDEVERVADAIAEVAMGQKIGYVGSSSCLVECLGKGKARPKGLR